LDKLEELAMSGTTKPASEDTGPRISAPRLVIGYAVLVAALAATLLGFVHPRLRRPVAVPFEGAEHDWAALELAARIASAHGAAIRLLGNGDGPVVWDVTDPLADAALVSSRGPEWLPSPKWCPEPASRRWPGASGSCRWGFPVNGRLSG
jgi:hypothetical protein